MSLDVATCYAQHGPMVLRRCRRLLGDEARAVDAMQDTFVRLLTHAGRLRMDVAQQLAAERFEVFEANRRAAEAVAADEADIAALEAMEKAARRGRKKGQGNG